MAQLYTSVKRILFITSNNAKLKDAQKLLNPDGTEIIGKKMTLVEIQSSDQSEIVTHKAKQAYAIEKEPVIVDDTAFFIENYPGFPGTLTKYVNSLLGLEGILKLIEEGYKASFVTMLCFKDKTNEVIVEGILKGRLTKKISKNFNPDTPLNSIFIPDGFDVPLSELVDNLDIGNTHRINAFKRLKQEVFQI